MKDEQTSRRLRITHGLMAGGFLVICLILALITKDILAGLLQLALLSLSWVVAVLWIDHFDELPGGKQSARERRILQVVLPTTFVLGFSAAVLAKGNADLAATLIASGAGLLALATGAFSVWLAVR